MEINPQMVKEQEGSFDSYDPVVGKWMTSGHHTNYGKSYEEYAELNRQKD